MTMIASYNLENDTWTQHNGENPARKAFRDAVEVVAVHTREKLPETINGRIDAAVKIVLQGDVEQLEGDKAKIGSQSNGVTKYHLVDGTCDCRDFEKAPENWCKHRIAYGIYKRATALVQEQLQAVDVPAVQHEEPVLPSVETPVESAEQVAVETPATPVVPLPEALASVNCHIMVEGRQIQITLRDTDETRLLARLATLLQQYPLPQPQPQVQSQSAVPPAPPVPQPQVAVSSPDSPYCHTHHVALKQFSKEGRTWYSHKTPDGSWCKGN